MSKVNIFWDPLGVSVDSLGSKKYRRVTDGDTPYIELSIRMLSIDTPEEHYPGTTKPSKHDQLLKDLADWIKGGNSVIKKPLADHLHPKLVTGQAGTLQETQAEKATEAFRNMLERKLKKSNDRWRSVFLRAADQHFDQYGRLLAYMSPYYTAKELEGLTLRDRATFNLMMVEEGWAAPFPIYPSIPKYSDLVMLQEAAKDAVEGQKGTWSNTNALTGYEFRMCIRLSKIMEKLKKNEKMTSRDRGSWIYRYCVDMTNRKVYFPQDYHKVKVWNRIFVWPEDIREAVGKLNLVPA